MSRRIPRGAVPWPPGAKSGALGLGRPKRHKYGARRTTVDGHGFASRAEARRFGELRLLQRAGKVLWFALQPGFALPGGVKYRADFVVAWADGRVTVEDVKGFRTAQYDTKRRIVEGIYRLHIEEKE